MQYVSMVIVGLIVGILARFFYPGAIHMGLIMSAVLGIAGSFLAGFVGQLLHPATKDQPFHPAGFLYSILGAIVLIFLARHIFGWV
ncbi:GlsB/YeaQ/YmgE family stress response membrane protein [Sphingomonas sp. So64.6b]|uniref:GlsB/YeaQ/YmgE family stress response membrane protein n=1 Tax=Sphingomonas sp. So64.6b TaxID=2997354 RepID=UPI0015FF966B|nr:GlsB/YeaQ/YmgE family stress response membrane protein [Sphingomonas sp. So64.6b]QNA83816.1 GlsB/YeaQ/YmgE family stress response membrane protein [Sphingomonas sp. So64.6b]